MKKILLLGLLSFTLIFSCSKDDDENCNCGVITNDEINSDGDYTLSTEILAQIMLKLCFHLWYLA